ncbi:DUF6288 domain-containing protein [Luteolibacter sp. Populi]|uniref:DUF6288 domain-containing protein n=1 Tax=Luteolibacter sp. Populi TaxID=3230487 RepID=UPI00346515D3
MRYGIFSLFAVVSAAAALGAPIEVEPFPAKANWTLPGGESGVLLEKGQSSAVSVKVPGLTDKEKDVGGRWRGVISVDVYGTAQGGKGTLELEALDPPSGEVFAKTTATAGGRAPRAEWGVIASSGQSGAEAERAFDGNPGTDWHTRHGADQASPPHWIGLEFAAPRKLEGIRYQPRPGGYANGVAKNYRLEIRKPGADWETVAKGESPKQVADSRTPLVLNLPGPIEVEAFRFVIESDWSGGGFGTAGEIVPLGISLTKKTEPVAATSRAWLEIPDKLMDLLPGKTFGLRVRAGDGQSVVVGTPRFSRVNEKPTDKLFGRSNGGSGPDLLGAGLLGFDALTEDKQSVLTVMEVRTGSPAAKAKLKEGDVILSSSELPLPLNELNPGWDWFRHSHEAALGRNSEILLKSGKRSMPLAILRDGLPLTVNLELPRTRSFTTMDPATDPEAAALLKDMLALLEDTQRENGSWSDDIIRTTFSSLALMATGDKKYRGRVKKAVEWSMEKYPKPDAYGNLGFWYGAYAGILYSEWHLLTGDKKVLPHLEALRDWAVNGKHNSIWNVPALGHGPSGLPYENKALVAPACHLLVFEALACRCGMKSGIWEMIMPFMEMAWSNPKEGGHGSLGYNRSYKDTEEFWSRSGLFSMAAYLRGERPDMSSAMVGFMEKNHPWIRNSHAYGEPGGSWGLLGLNLVKPEAYTAVMKEYAWWFSLAWEPGYGLHFTQPHMGAPYMGEEDLINATYALVLQAPKRNLHLTGAHFSGR